MRETPPQDLIDLLARLHLASSQQVRGMQGRVRRMAQDLPLFASVWIDALAQARILTPFQAREINAGRGELLRVGPYVLCQPLGTPGCTPTYVAREARTRRNVRLAVFPATDDHAESWLRQLETLTAKGRAVESDLVTPATHAGRDGLRLWVSSRLVEGRTAGEWMIHHGRFPADAVLEIARQMLSALAVLERAGICHGDVSVWNLVLSTSGRAVLVQPGLRGVIRPQEGYARADLTPECYDYLAPERIVRGAPPTTASDLYACACVWWHLLTGRPAMPGGNNLAKLRAVQEAAIPDVRRLAPDTPQSLADAIRAGLQRDPAKRPASIDQGAAMLGAATPRGRMVLTRAVVRPGRRGSAMGTWASALRGRATTSLGVTAAAVGLLGLAALTWSLWKKDGPPKAGLPSPVAGARAVDRRPSESRTFAEASPTHGRSDAPKDTSSDEDLVLAALEPRPVETLPLRSGQRVRGRPGVRPLVRIAPSGLVVREEDVRFEGIDFVWEAGQAPESLASGPVAMLRLEASRVEFHGCSFQASARRATVPAAIEWGQSSSPPGLDLTLPNGRLKLTDCLFRRVGAVVRDVRSGAIALEISNAIHQGVGPLLQLSRCPKSDESVLLSLSSVTLRDSGPLLECVYSALEQQAGSISIQTNNSVLATNAQSSLLSFVGPVAPERLLSAIEWTGQGSLVVPETMVARWRNAEGRLSVLDDSSVSIAGLVRSTVGFADAADRGPAASRIVRWQAPLQSASPPGADPRGLAWPTDAFDKAKQ
jgi:hypothetical protein